MASQISALPTAPSRTDPATFATRADAFVAALATFRTEANTLATEAEADAATASASAATAVTSAAAAEAAAAAASLATDVTKWISGTTYAEGQCVWSPADYAVYRRISAGGGTTDPSADTANWAAVIPSTTWTTITADPAPAVKNRGYFLNSSGGAFNLTLPASPSTGDTVQFCDLGSAQTNKITVSGNGNNVMGSATFGIDSNYASGTLIYSGASFGWRIKL